MSQRYYLISVGLNRVFPNSIFFVRLFPSIIVAQIGEKISGNGENSETSHISLSKDHSILIGGGTHDSSYGHSIIFRVQTFTKHTQNERYQDGIRIRTSIELDLKQSELKKLSNGDTNTAGTFHLRLPVTTWMGMNLNILPYLLHLLRCLMVQSTTQCF